MCRRRQTSSSNVLQNEMLRNTYLSPYWQGLVRLYFIVRIDNAVRAFEWNRTLSNLFRLISLFGTMTLTTIIAVQSTDTANSDSARRFWFFVSSLVLSSIIGIGNELNHNFHFGERAKLWSRYISDVRTLGMNFFGLCGKFKDTVWDQSVHEFVHDLAALERQLTRDIESLGSNQSSGGGGGGSGGWRFGGEEGAGAGTGAGKKTDFSSEPVIITSGEPPRGGGKDGAKKRGSDGDGLGSDGGSSGGLSMLGRTMTRPDILQDFSLLSSATMQTPPGGGAGGAKAVNVDDIINELPSPRGPRAEDGGSTDSNTTTPDV